MRSDQVRKKFLSFFEKRGHAILPSASLIPENDPSALFTTAGVQPLVPYILQGAHPQGPRLASVQKCVRTTDIDDIGDKTHGTFFEMLGNWSIGDYFKEDAIQWSYELLTSEEGFGLDSNRLYVTVYEGDSEVPKDTESVEFWKKAGIPENRIYFLGESNFWSAGDNGPCGPSTEMFYDLTEEGLGDLSPEEFSKADEEQKVVEIWNDVFMEYRKENGKVVGKLPKKNVDTGSGLERLLTVLQKKDNIFETDLFSEVMAKINELKTKGDTRAERVVADHIRTASFLITDGVTPSNTDQGYVLRRLIRRAVRMADVIGMPKNSFQALVVSIINTYKDQYPQLTAVNIFSVIDNEEVKFRKTLEQGLKQLEKISGDVSGKDAFMLFASYGFPIEMTEEIAKEKNVSVDREAFDKELEEHQQKSKTASAGKFKGGLGGHSEQELKYHTATHLLNAALRQVLGGHIEQKGSNINPERLRFDFLHPEKLTNEQKQQVEELVNSWIEQDLPVTCKETSVEKAKRDGALGVFESKYGDKVTVYTVGEGEKIASKEICGGPHVERTGILGTFKIKKEEASSAGVRRIKAILV